MNQVQSFIQSCNCYFNTEMTTNWIKNAFHKDISNRKTLSQRQTNSLCIPSWMWPSSPDTPNSINLASFQAAYYVIHINMPGFVLVGFSAYLNVTPKLWNLINWVCQKLKSKKFYFYYSTEWFRSLLQLHFFKYLSRSFITIFKGGVAYNV